MRGAFRSDYIDVICNVISLYHIFIKLLNSSAVQEKDSQNIHKSSKKCNNTKAWHVYFRLSWLPVPSHDWYFSCVSFALKMSLLNKSSLKGELRWFHTSKSVYRSWGVLPHMWKKSCIKLFVAPEWAVLSLSQVMSLEASLAGSKDYEFENVKIWRCRVRKELVYQNSVACSLSLLEAEGSRLHWLLLAHHTRISNWTVGGHVALWVM